MKFQDFLKKVYDSSDMCERAFVVNIYAYQLLESCGWNFEDAITKHNDLRLILNSGVRNAYELGSHGVPFYRLCDLHEELEDSNWDCNYNTKEECETEYNRVKKECIEFYLNMEFNYGEE